LWGVVQDLGLLLVLLRQASYVVGAALVKARESQVLAQRGVEAAGQRFAALSGSADLSTRWKPLAAFVAAGTVLVVLLRKLLRSN
jgi:hypothetical protein